MEGRSLEAESLLASAESAEVLSSFWNYIRTKLQGATSTQISLELEVVRFRSGHCALYVCLHVEADISCKRTSIIPRKRKVRLLNCRAPYSHFDAAYRRAANSDVEEAYWVCHFAGGVLKVDRKLMFVLVSALDCTEYPCIASVK